MSYRMRRYWQVLVLLVVTLLSGVHAFAQDQVYPDPPNPPRLVNDYAHILKPEENNQLENKLEDFARSTSNRVTIITIKNLGGPEISEYSVEVFNRWGLGAKGKDNGVLLLVSTDDHKAWITVGRGLEAVLTDAKSGQIFRNELRPAFKEGNYYKGLSDASDAIIAVTKGEYKGDGIKKDDRNLPITGLIILVIFIGIILRLFRGGGGGGGGWGNFATGMLLGSMMDGGRSSGGWGGGSSGGGGFGGFGGGSTGGGGAGGSW
jgi:uncharacterized protein